jgi:hypothetical protein
MGGLIPIAQKTRRRELLFSLGTVLFSLTKG